MKKVITIVGWVLCFFFVFLTIGSISTSGITAAIFSLAAAVLVCPLFRSRVGLPGKIWIPAVVVLLFLTCLFAPKSEIAPLNTESLDSVESSALSSEKTSVEESVDNQTQVEDVVELDLDSDQELETEPDDKAGTEDKNDFDTSLGKDISDYDITFTDTVRNDVTGNWRLARVAEYELADIQDYSLSYYREYFKSDDEVHFIVNFSLNTTTRINYASGTLFVTVFDYVDGEEHDAKQLPAGEMLSSYSINVEDGSIEDISD